MGLELTPRICWVRVDIVGGVGNSPGSGWVRWERDVLGVSFGYPLCILAISREGNRRIPSRTKQNEQAAGPESSDLHLQQQERLLSGCRITNTSVYHADCKKDLPPSTDCINIKCTFTLCHLVTRPIKVSARFFVGFSSVFLGTTKNALTRRSTRFDRSLCSYVDGVWSQHR